LEATTFKEAKRARMTERKSTIVEKLAFSNEKRKIVGE
jgi:hypothetical protein